MDDALQRSMSVAETVLSILARVVGTDEVRANRDLRLFDLALLDSLKTVDLMIALSEELGVEISPAAFEPDDWATPNRIVANIENLLRR